MSKRKGYNHLVIDKIYLSTCIDDIRSAGEYGRIVDRDGNTYLSINNKMYYISPSGDSSTTSLSKYIKRLEGIGCISGNSIIELSNIRRVLSDVLSAYLSSKRMLIRQIDDLCYTSSNVMMRSLGFGESKYSNGFAGFTHYVVYGDKSRILWLLLDNIGGGLYTASSPPYKITKDDMQGMASIDQDLIIPPMSNMCRGVVLLPLFSPRMLGNAKDLVVTQRDSGYMRFFS